MFSVLYVDDEPGLLEIGTLFLERSGTLAVETASSAAEAIEKLHSHRYDGIISDFQMPQMDGIEFLKYIRATYGDLPFILFTGRGREEVVIEALNHGADFYLQKGGDPVSQFVELEHKITLAIERKRTMDELHESRQRMADVINFLPDATFAIDLDGKVIAWNQAMEEMTGVKSDEILGVDDFRYAVPFYGESRPLLIDQVLAEEGESTNTYHQVIQEGDKLISEFFVPRLYGGRGAYLWFIASPLYDTKGRIVGAIESIRDVTGRKQAEEEREAARQKLLDIIDFLPDATFVIDTERRVIAWNRAMEEMSGVKKEEMLGKGEYAYAVPFYGEAMPILIDLVQEPDAEFGPRYHDLERDGDTVVAGMYLPLLAGGRGAYLWGKASPLYNDQGEIIGAIESLRDITEYKQAEDARLNAIVQGSPIPQFVLDSDHRVAYWNEALEAYSGIRAVEIVGTREHWKAFYPEERQCLADLLIDRVPDKVALSAWYGGKYSRSRFVEGAFEGTDFFPEMGEEGTWLYFTAAPLRDTRGRVIGAVETLEDITEQRRTEEALKASEVKYRTLFENSGSPVIIVEEDTTISLVNQEFERLSGYTREEVEGRMSWRDFVASEDDLEMVAEYHRVRRTDPGRAPEVYECHLRNRTGTVKDVIISVAMVPETLQGIVAVMDITGRKKGEEARRLADLIDFMPDALFAVDTEGKVIAWNRAIEEMTGVAAVEILGKGGRAYSVPLYGDRRPLLLDLLTASPEKLDARGYREIERHGDFLIAETAEARPQGREVVQKVFAAPLYDEAGEMTGAIEGIRDITSRKESEEALKRRTHDLNERVKELRCLYAISNILVDPGATVEEVMHRIVAVVPQAWQYPEVTAVRIAIEGEVYQTGSFRTTEWMQERSIVADREAIGRIEVAYLEEWPERDEGPFLQEEHDLLITISQRIGQYLTRTQVEEERNTSEAELRALFASMTDVVIVYDGEGRCQKIAPTNPALLYRPGDELVGKTVAEVFPGPQAGIILDRIREALECGVPVTLEYSLPIEGREVWFAAVISPMTEDSVILVARDITERKIAEMAVRTANKKLKLLSSITRHDILNQLTVLHGFLELAKMETTDPTLLEYIEKEEMAAESIRRQIEFTRDYQEIGVAAPGWQEVRRVITRSVRALDLEAVSLLIEFEGLEVYADPLLEKVFFNLVDNALRYGEKVTRVRFSCVEEGEKLIILCEDDGVGIPEEFKEGIFRREYYKNTGLGLYLSREILAITRFAIRETGIPGEGARFEITVPKRAYRFYRKG
ncbi:PAS domain S-box-containing protein [Methanofollis sp. W23]|nr:PAS domain S-box-containing protein [Methanofollis sp. W23]